MDKTLKLQKYKDLEPMFNVLKQHFPQYKPQDVINKIDQLRHKIDAQKQINDE